MDKLEEVITHYVRTLLDANGIQADAESEISAAFRQAYSETHAEINRQDLMISKLTQRVKEIERFLQL